jgi:hypothetical protein
MSIDRLITCVDFVVVPIDADDVIAFYGEVLSHREPGAPP